MPDCVGGLSGRAAGLECHHTAGLKVMHHVHPLLRTYAGRGLILF
jgi:hypothetical protein